MPKSYQHSVYFSYSLTLLTAFLISQAVTVIALQEVLTVSWNRPGVMFGYSYRVTYNITYLVVLSLLYMMNLYSVCCDHALTKIKT